MLLDLEKQPGLLAMGEARSAQMALFAGLSASKRKLSLDISAVQKPGGKESALEAFWASSESNFADEMA